MHANAPTPAPLAAGGAAGRIKVAAFHGLDGLRALRDDWRAIDGSSGLYARYEVFEAFATHLLDAPERLRLLRCADPAGVLAVLPCVPEEGRLPPFGRVRAAGLGRHLHVGWTDFPLAARADPRLVARALARSPHGGALLWWQRVPVGGAAHRVAQAWPHPVCLRPAPPRNDLDTTQTFAALASGLSKNLRASLQKSRKRLGTDGAWRVVVTGGGGPEAAQAFATFLQLEASGWKGSGGTGSAVALDPRLAAFYRRLLEAGRPDLRGEIAVLEAAGRPAAAQFAMVDGQCRHVLKIAYDESLARYSPGQVLLEEMLKRACADPALSVTSLVSDMPWHQAWRPVPEPCVEVVIVRGRSRRLAFRAYGAVLSALRALRDGWRRRRARPPVHADRPPSGRTPMQGDRP